MGIGVYGRPVCRLSVVIARSSVQSVDNIRVAQVELDTTVGVNAPEKMFRNVYALYNRKSPLHDLVLDFSGDGKLKSKFLGMVCPRKMDEVVLP